MSDFTIADLQCAMLHGVVASFDADAERAIRALWRSLAVASSLRYYEPGYWIPHCTAAIDLPPDRIGAAVQICRASRGLRTGRLVEFGLVETPPTRELAALPLLGV